jgi:hypothetical protein
MVEFPMTTKSVCRNRFLLLVASAGCIAGCMSSTDGPELHSVSGEVLMDGKALPNARVVFTPRTGGKPAVGMTDSNGAYRLDYSDQGRGTPTGDYSVTVSTFQAGEASDGSTASPPSRETVPVTYNKKTTLTAKVPGDSASYRFELKSGGEVIQPTPPKGMF